MAIAVDLLPARPPNEQELLAGPRGAAGDRRREAAARERSNGRCPFSRKGAAAGASLKAPLATSVGEERYFSPPSFLGAVAYRGWR